MSKTDKSSKAKTKKHMKVSKKNKIIIAVSIVLAVLICFSYVAMQIGLPAKVLTGAKIVKTTDGKEKTVKRIPIVEMNYYFTVAANQLMAYGSGIDASQLDEVCDPNTGKTYRDVLWEEAASSAQGDYLLYEEAMNSGFKPSCTDRYVELQVDSVRQTCDYMNALRGTNMTADQYLQSTYGTGMTMQIYRRIMRRTAVIEEFSAYLQQTTMVPNQETVQKKFDESPETYTFVNYQLYFVSAELPEETTEEEKTKLLAEAEKKAHKIADDCKDVEEFQKRALEFSSDDYKERFEKGEVTMAKTGGTKANLTNASPEFAEMCFNPETKPLTTMVFKDSEDQGYFAAMFEEAYIKEDPTASYRVIVLRNGALSDMTASEEEKAAAIQEAHKDAEELMAKATSEDEFIKLAKENSEDMNSFTRGGYYEGVTQNSFSPVDPGDGSEPKLSDADQKLVDWLFDSSRKAGDMIIIDSGSSVNLYYFHDTAPAWMASLRAQMASENYTTWANGIVSNPIYSVIVNHGLIDFFS